MENKMTLDVFVHLFRLDGSKVKVYLVNSKFNVANMVQTSEDDPLYIYNLKDKVIYQTTIHLPVGKPVSHKKIRFTKLETRYFRCCVCENFIEYNSLSAHHHLIPHREGNHICPSNICRFCQEHLIKVIDTRYSEMFPSEPTYVKKSALRERIENGILSGNIIIY